MNARSSAWFIAYDIRPSKQVERRLVFETLQSAKTAGITIEKLPFIGMGGVRFIDFMLANRTLGITRFESLEHDEDILARCEFNKPFHDLSVFPGTSDDYIKTKGFLEPAIVWFDYESGVSTDLKDDMVTLAGAVKPGTFVFITATAELPPVLRNVKGLPKRLAALQELVAPFGDALEPQETNSSNFHLTTAKILNSALNFGFSGRGDGVFYPYLRLNYKDTTWMTTIGGYFGKIDAVRDLRKAIVPRCAFLKPNDPTFIYQVHQFNITDAERRLLDRAAISGKNRRSERMALRKIGFGTALINQYAELMRFIPRYFESVL